MNNNEEFDRLTIGAIRLIIENCRKSMGAIQDYVQANIDASHHLYYVEQTLIEDHRRLMKENAELRKRLNG